MPKLTANKIKNFVIHNADLIFLGAASVGVVALMYKGVKDINGRSVVSVLEEYNSTGCKVITKLANGDTITRTVVKVADTVAFGEG